MEKTPVAEMQITLINGISVNVYLDKSGRQYLVWFEMAYMREEYEEFGMGQNWDEAAEFCHSTEKSPWMSGRLDILNRRIREVNKYQDGSAFSETGGAMHAVRSRRGS